MQITQKIYNLYHTYTQSDYCPSLSKIVKSAACVAGAILGWRYAPKTTFIIVTGAAFYHALKNFLPKTSSSPQREEPAHNTPKESPLNPEEQNQTELESKPTKPTPVAIETPLEAPPLQEKRISSEEELKTFLTQLATNYKLDITPAFEYLCHITPSGLDILEWTPKDIQNETREALLQGSTNLVPEHIAFMKTVFLFSAILDHYKAILKNFVPVFKKKQTPLSDPQIRQFIIKILFLSRYPELEKVAKVKGASHPLLPVSFGMGSYICFLACQQWYAVSQERRYLDSINDINHSALQIIEKNENATALAMFLLKEIATFKKETPLPPPDYSCMELEEPITSLYNELSRLAKGGSKKEVKPVFFNLLKATYKLKPKDIDLLDWKPCTPGSQKHIDDIEKRSQKAIKEIATDFCLETPPAYLIDFSLLDQADSERRFMMHTFYLSASLNPGSEEKAGGNRLTEVLIETLKSPDDKFSSDPNFRKFLLGVLWLSEYKDVKSFVLSKYPAWKKHTHPLTKENKPLQMSYERLLAHISWYKATPSQKYKNMFLNLKTLFTEDQRTLERINQDLQKNENNITKSDLVAQMSHKFNYQIFEQSLPNIQQ